MAPWLQPATNMHADDTSIHTGTVAAAAVAQEEAVLPFGAASNALLSLPKCIGMLLGHMAGVPPAGTQAQHWHGLSAAQQCFGAPPRHPAVCM
jgi:hypothetical protein